MTQTLSRYFLTIFLLLSLEYTFAQEKTAAPPLSRSTIKVEGKTLQIDYFSKISLNATLTSNGGFTTVENIYEDGNQVTQVLIIESGSYKDQILLEGTLAASAEAFPCEAMPPAAGPLIVRHSSGLSHSLRNRAVYDRSVDWLLSIEPGPDVVISPLEETDRSTRFRITVRGSKIILRILPHYYREFRGLKQFKPWEYQPWKSSVAGWCSWFAYFKEIDETKMKHAADIVSEYLLPYGFTYFQMDDGFQQEPWGTPETWLVANPKFPSGLDNLAGYISGLGLKPGIWTYASFQEKDFVKAHPGWFVRNSKNEPVAGRWIYYPVDASVAAVRDSLITPVYSGFEEMGWKYFKVDGLRHLRYEGYNTFKDYFESRSLDREMVFRDYLRVIRKAVGRENFILGCWGVRPELVGLIDGCRIGGDGFSYAGLAQYNSFNNVVWRNDPDHVELTEEDAYRSCMVTSLTGSLLMLTDDPETYFTEITEPARRAAPVLFTRPGQVYDIDPSRSSLIEGAQAEVSGEGERSFDASRTPVVELYLLEVNRDYENWMVLGRTGETFREILFRDLGLDPNRPYLLFEFWTRQFLGEFEGSFSPGKIDPGYNCQLFCIREKQTVPQLLATGRHLSCGGPDLLDVAWDDETLSGESLTTAAEPYTIYIYEPEGYKYLRSSCDGAGVIRNVISHNMRSITFQSTTPGPITWSVIYTTDKE